MPNAASQNWLLISFDQWRGDWLYQPWLHLPYLQSIATEGWDLRRCYTSSPQCVPARVSWLTGQRPADIGLTTNRPYTVPADAPSFVRNLQQDFRYTTALVGKTHWTPHNGHGDLRDNVPLLKALGFDRAREIAGPRALARLECELTDRWREAGVFDLYKEDLKDRYRDGRVHCVRSTVLPDALYPDLWLTGIALEELARLPMDQPWLLWVSFPGPHEPFDVPSSWSRQRFIPKPQSRPPLGPAQLVQAPQGSVLDGKLQRWPHGLPHEAVQALRQDYANHLELLDAQVGRLLLALERRDDVNRTAISVCSDHGELLGDWGLMLKGCFLEGAIRSLFLHRPPGGRAAWRRLWRPGRRPFGLTSAMWAAMGAVSNPSEGSFGYRLRRMTSPVTVDYADEVMTVV